VFGPQEGCCEKNVKSKVVAKKWLLWEANGKIDNSGEFGIKSLRNVENTTTQI